MSRLNKFILPALIVAAVALLGALIFWQTRASVNAGSESAGSKTNAPVNTGTSSRPFDMYIFTPGQTITVPTLNMAVSLEESSMQCPDLENTNGNNTNTANVNGSTTKPCDNPQYYARFKTVNIQQGAPTTPTTPTPQQDSLVFTTVPGQQIVNGHQVQLVELTQESARVLVFTATVNK